MHRLLKRQLKKAHLLDSNELIKNNQICRLLEMIDQCYQGFDDDRYLMERSMEISSKEMQQLYQQLEQSSKEKIQQSVAKFNRLVKNLSKHYFFYSRGLDGNFTYISDSIQIILGYTPDEFRDNFDHYLTDNPINLQIIYHTQEISTGNIYPPYHVEIMHKNGTVTTLEVTEIPIRDKSNTVIGVDGIARDISCRLELEKKLDHQAKHDSLTGLPNRHLFLDRLDHSLKRADSENNKVTVFLLDLDHFKEINESLSHKVGDELLVQLTGLLKSNVRQSDTVSRLGGDEFGLIIEGLNQTNMIIEIAQKLIRSMNQLQTIGTHQFFVSFSIGIAVYPNDAKSPDELLKNADAAMYKAKKEGRNNYQFYTSDMTEHALEHVMLETQLRNALKDNQLEVYYQCLIEASNDSLLGMEALVRWNHPEQGLIQPAKFIGLAEETGLIVQLDNWVMNSAIKQWAKWNEAGLNPGKLSLNLSRLTIVDQQLISRLLDRIKTYNINPRQLIFEVTESQIMRKKTEAIKTLNSLHDLGVEIAIDDFGTGYSSLSYLKKLPIDKLKIDQSFIHDITIDKDDMEITRTIIAMANGLNLSVLAEGVETNEQKEFLINNNCHEIQGFLYHRPSPAKDTEKLLYKMNKRKL